MIKFFIIHYYSLDMTNLENKNNPVSRPRILPQAMPTI